MISVKQSRVTWHSVVVFLPFLWGCGSSDGVPGSHGSGSASRVVLSAPDAAFTESFSSISGLRELPDGRVLLADRLGQALIAVDFAAGAADTIGRTGGGPGEYSSPGRLFPWRGDSTLMVDMGNTRFTPVSADGGLGVSIPLMNSDGESMSLVLPEGTDRFGNVYFQARSLSMGRPGSNGAPDSARVVRWNPETGESDTVAALTTPERRMSRSGDNVSVTTIPFSPYDQWAASWDGNVAVVRGSGFRVEWADIDGSVTVGDQLDYDPVAITQEDRDAWLEARANPSGGMFISISAGGGGADVSTAPPPRGARMAGPQVAEEDWPEVKPPFPPSAVSIAPEGELWVLRHVSFGSPPEYDVFDDSGSRLQTVVLPENSRVVGFGQGVVYVARTDEYDLQWLERYSR